MTTANLKLDYQQLVIINRNYLHLLVILIENRRIDISLLSKIIFVIFLFHLDELTCVEGYIKRNWKSYLTAWSTFSFPPGNTLSNQEACWRLVKQKFDNAVGLLFNHNVGFCRGIINAGPLLPWPTFFPDSRTTVKLCILKNVAGESILSIYFQNAFIQNFKSIVWNTPYVINNFYLKGYLLQFHWFQIQLYPIQLRWLPFRFTFILDLYRVSLNHYQNHYFY